MERNEFGVSKDQMIKYMERKHDEIIEMEECLKKMDFATLENFGHKIKGNGEPFGHKELATLGAAIEQSAKQKNLGETQALFKKIKEYIKKQN